MAVHLGPPSGDAADQPQTGPGAPPESVNDATTVSGQDPSSLFGIPVSYDSGAAGSAGEAGHPEGDPTNMAGQVYEGISGLGPDAIAESGAPGGTGVNTGYTPVAPGVPLTITDPNYMAGRPGGGSGNQFITVSEATSGPNDSTTVPGQYGVPNAMPGLGTQYQPTDTGAGRGRVMVGGREVGPGRRG